jgi:uncharacterized protein involved in exopolysaccharide biosynthesis
MQEQGYSLQDVTDLFRRRWRLMGGITLSTFLASAVTAYSLGNLYRATAEIDIQCPEITDVPGVACGEFDRSQRVDRLNDRVMSRENLAALIEKHNLYPEERGDGPPTSVIREMRPNVKVELTLDEDDPRSRQPGEIMGFTVSYFYREPAATRDVTRELAALFVRESAQRSEAAVNSAEVVLQRQLETLRKRLQDQEALLAQFQTRNPGAMPEDRDFNRIQLERKQTELEGIDRQIRDLDGQLQILANQIANTEPYIGATDLAGGGAVDSLESCRAVQAQFRDLLARYSAQHPDVIQTRRQLEQVCGATGTGLREAIELQLATRRAELAELRRGLPAEHPDVRRLERMVESLEENLASAPIEDTSRAPDNPVYVQLAIRQQSLRSEVGALRGRRDALVTQIASLEGRLQIAPEVERELKELTRGYEQAKKAFDEAERNLIDLSRERLAETWVLHKDASLPYKPAFPNRPLILIIGLLLGLTLAAITILAIEALDGTVRGTRDVRTMLDMPPIAAVPFVATAGDISRARTRRFATIATTVLAIALTGTYVYLQRGGII